MRTIQHKREAYWFYRFLSNFYDQYVNPLFWTTEMRTQALELADLNSPDLRTLEVGSGTGFTTLGIVHKIEPPNITCIDQSPHQMARARKKVEINGCTFQLGDAENLPFSKNSFDRCISAGSIEYWPDPQKGISEAHRILKPGGIALIIGPLHPQNWLARFLADTWMLFPEEQDYFDWFKAAGFEEVKTTYIKPPWVKTEKYGIAIAGTKPHGESIKPQQNVNQFEEREQFSLLRTIILIGRLVIGSLAGFLFIPIALLGHLRRFIIKKFGNKQTDSTN